MEYKRYPVEVFEYKAEGEDPGYFKARVAVFNNIDDGGDRIVPGAFKKSLKANPRPPVVWSHQWNIPPIGQTLAAKETDLGLEIEGKLLLDDPGISGQYANSVLSGFKAGVLKEFSFAFDVQDSAEVKEKGKTIRELKQVDVFEVGPTLVGMNRSTELLEVASQGGRALDDLADRIVERMQKAGAFVESKAAIAPHNTSVVDGTWDKGTAMMACSNSDDPAAAFRSICAWYAGDNPDQRQSYKFPHHSTPGGPANLNGVRNALSRVSQAQIPSGDVAGVERHLNHHLEAAKASQLHEEPQGQLDEEPLSESFERFRRLITAIPDIT